MSVTPAASDDQPFNRAPGSEPGDAARDPGRPRLTPRLAAIPLGIGAVLLGVYLGLAQRDAAHVDEANRLGMERRYVEAERAARAASRPPASDRAQLVIAYTLRDQGRLADASRAFGAAARVDPNNWTIHRDHALVLLQLGEGPRARRAMGRALALNPRMRLPPPFQR